MFFLFCLTFAGNVFVIAAILIEKNLQNVANYLIVSLAVADLMVACLVMPLGAVYEVSVLYMYTFHDPFFLENMEFIITDLNFHNTNLIKIWRKFQGFLVLGIPHFLCLDYNYWLNPKSNPPPPTSIFLKTISPKIDLLLPSSSPYHPLPIPISQNLFTWIYISQITIILVPTYRKSWKIRSWKTVQMFFLNKQKQKKISHWK